MAIKSLSDGMSLIWRRIIFIIYWMLSVLLLLGVFLYRQIDPEQFKNLRLYIVTLFFVLLVGKFFVTIFLMLEDIRRGLVWIVNLFPIKKDKHSISRSTFIQKMALVTGTIPIVTMSFGIISGAYDYRVRKRVITFPNLPQAFDGIHIAHISDIHTGSFFNKTAVAGGVDLLLKQKPDIVFFTGDLVNNKSEEAKNYLDTFKKINAPLGVFSVMGNHDYGDYTSWPSKIAKQKDIRNLHNMHAYMEYNLLLNENRTIKVDNEEIAILGCENWGSGRFAKYGDIKKTVQGIENKPYKILLSHDPSHWNAQITSHHKSIDLTLSGHTHGMQFGIEIGNFRWSPIQYRYKQWADLYREENQYLYVNRGYGFIGYPGRVGILPEITIIELKRS